MVCTLVCTAVCTSTVSPFRPSYKKAPAGRTVPHRTARRGFLIAYYCLLSCSTAHLMISLNSSARLSPSFTVKPI